MKSTTPELLLEERIKFPEFTQKQAHTALRVQFKESFEQLKPINLLKNALQGHQKPHGIAGNLVDVSIGIAAGSILKKMIFGSTLNPIKLAVGAGLQYTATRLVTKNASVIKSLAMNLLSKVLKPEAKK